MCDLALTSSRGNFTQRINEFSKAVHGLAPLIIDVWKKGVTLEHLAMQAEKISDDPDEMGLILKSWENASGNMDIFQEVEFRHGSMEEHAIKQLQEVFDRGVFTIKTHSESFPAMADNYLNLFITFKEENENLVAKKGFHQGSVGNLYYYLHISGTFGCIHLFHARRESSMMNENHAIFSL